MPPAPNTNQPWKPRGSALGHYVACSCRAAFDRAFHEAALEATEEELKQAEAAKESSPYADLGTCIHFTLQDGLKCAWGHGTRADHVPTDAQYANAASLFSNNLDLCKGQVWRSAVLAAAHLKDRAWVAETEVITDFITGHIDFLSTDGKVLVDLKTTAKPPLAGRAKPAHMAQTLIYCAALEALTGKHPELVTILYVDSINAAWAHPIHLDLTFEPLIAYMHQLRDFARFLMGDQLYASATPNFGHACEEWCPWTSLCRDRVYSAMVDGRATTPTPVRVRSPIV